MSRKVRATHRKHVSEKQKIAKDGVRIRQGEEDREGKGKMETRRVWKERIGGKEEGWEN